MVSEHGIYLFCKIYKKNKDNKYELVEDDIFFHTSDYLLKICDSSGKEYFNSANIFMPAKVDDAV